MTLASRIGPRLIMVKPRKVPVQARWRATPRLQLPKKVVYYAGQAMTASRK